jgi:hypothetical protein
MKAPEAMIDEIGNYLSLDRIGTAGQPTGEQFSRMKPTG